MKIKLCRINVLQGQINQNFERIAHAIQLARQENYEMVVFSTNSLGGVFLGEYLNNQNFIAELLATNHKIQALANDIYVVWGNLISENTQGIMIAKNDYSECIVQKNNDYRFFNDSKHFNDSTQCLKTLILDNKQEIVIGFADEAIDERYHLLFANHEVGNSSQIKIPNGVHINHFGVENINKNIVIFDGKIQVFKHQKLIVCEDSLKSIQQDIDLLETKNHNLLAKVVWALQEFDQQVFKKRLNWVVGLSGGLDSSVSCALLVKAFGSQRVLAYNLATKYNSETTKNIAKELATKLQIQYREGNITPLVNSTHDVLNQYGYSQYSDLTTQNIQARIRGHLLSSFASIENAVIVNNGNKVETTLGYATMYGDMIGAISPLADLSKVQLFELARMINSEYNDEIISESLLPQADLTWIQKPSAELQVGQFDPMKWFYHDYLIENLNVKFSLHEFLSMYLNDSLPSEIQKWIDYYELNDPKLFIADIEWFINTAIRNQYKLLQAPPIIALSSRSFGSDIDVIQGTFEDVKYQALKNSILNKKLND